MPLVKHGAIVSDPWTALSVDDPMPEHVDVVVPLSRLDEALARAAGRTGVLLKGDEGPETLGARIDALDLIAVEFAKFTDGRGYTTARLLRERFGYRQELRAVGHVLRDQVFFMARCGFDAFELARPNAAESVAAALGEMRVVYQAAADARTPAFRRRRRDAAPAWSVAAE